MKKETKVVSKVDFDKFDKEIVVIIKKGRIVRKSIDDSLRVNEKTLSQIIY